LRVVCPDSTVCEELPVLTKVKVGAVTVTTVVPVDGML
jgi:hypothetical protein